MNKLALLLKPLGPALRTNTTRKRLVTGVQKHLHKQLLEGHATSHPPLCLRPTLVLILCSPTAKPMRLTTVVFVCPLPRDSCCRTLQPQTPQAFFDVPQQRRTGQICGKSVDAQQHHCYGCRYGGDVDRRLAAVARCLAHVIHSNNGTKVYIEQSIPALTRVQHGQVEHTRMDLVFDQNGNTTYPSLPQPASAQATWPREPKKSTLSDIHIPLLFRLSWRSRATQDTTPKSLSATS